MSDILVRGLPPETLSALKLRAETQGRSVNATLKDIVVKAVADDAAARDWDRLRELRSLDRGKWKGPSIVAMLREDRDR